MNDLPVTVLVGSASPRLGADVCRQLGITPGTFAARRFPDGELQIELEEPVRGRDVFVIQSTAPPVADHLLELLLIADACRRAGSARLTAVIPYLGYARQDRRTGRQSLGARVVASAISTAQFDRLILVDAHTPAIEGFFDTPIDHLTAVPLLAEALKRPAATPGIVVAPDLGAVKRARTFARLLAMPMAVVEKTRISGEAVDVSSAIGPIAGRSPIVVDDMLSTGGTVVAAAQALVAGDATTPITVAVTHGLFAGRAVEALSALPLDRLLVTDSVEISGRTELRVEVISLAPLLATAIDRVHNGRSLLDLQAAV